MSAGQDDRLPVSGTTETLNPYGYCRYCGSPRPKGGLFCGGGECARSVRDRDAASTDRITPVVRTAPSVALPSGGRHVATDVHVQLLRDTSIVLVAGALILTIFGALGSAPDPATGDVLGATAAPSVSLAP